MGPPSALASARGALDPATTAFVLSGGEGGEMPGCGAISAVDVATGAVVYRGSHLGSSSGLSAAEDLTVLAAGAGSPSRAIKILPARDQDPSRWTAFQLSSPRGPYRISGSATAILDGHLWFGAVGGIEEGVGVGRIRLPGLDGDEAARKDINPVDDFYSVRADWVADILPDPNGRTVYVLSHEYRLPANAGEAIESLALRLHILDRAMLTSRTAAVPLPPLVVDEPPGAGLRETGVHNWRQNGQIAFSTLLAPSRAARGWQPLWAVVNRWRAPELAFANLRTMSGDQARVVTATLPSDYSIVGALAASRGPRNLGMLAVHGGDKIGLFEVEDPYRGIVKERARLAITPVVSPIIDDRRMMSGPIAWSADGSRIIAAGNEGAAEVLIDVEGCGDGLRLRHAVTACPYDGYNGLGGIVTAHGTALVPAAAPDGCPVPWWVGEPAWIRSGYVIALPWVGAGREGRALLTF
ncbi:MAG: hypothetical protein U0470_03475 [Anaerolineae bacterium]